MLRFIGIQFTNIMEAPLYLGSVLATQGNLARPTSGKTGRPLTKGVDMCRFLNKVATP